MRDETATVRRRPRAGLRRRRTSWRNLLVLTTLCTAAATTAAAAPANIDTGGFTQDGKTTYCQGVQHDQGPLVFESLVATSAGKCPIDVQISAAATSVAPLTPLAVHWSASVHRGALTTDLFPHAMDPLTQKPLDVIASLLRACKAGTNCLAPESVVEPAVFPDDRATDTGAFGSGGIKTLKAYQFQFPPPSGGVDDYIILAKVVLPGDPKLNVSAQEFLAFQRVRVGTDLNMTDSAKVRAGDASEIFSDSDAAAIARPATGKSPDSGPETRSALDDRAVAPTDPTPPAAGGGGTVDGGGGEKGGEKPGDGTTSRSRSSTQTGGITPVSMVGIAVLVVAMVLVAYAAVGMRKLKKQKLEAFVQRTTRSFSESFEKLDCDPEPLAPMVRRKESNDSRVSRALTARDLSVTLTRSQSGPEAIAAAVAAADAARGSRVSRISRVSRVSRAGGAGMKVPGGAAAIGSPSTRGGGIKRPAAFHETVDFTGRRSAAYIAGQHDPRWPSHHQELRASQKKLSQSRLKMHDLEASQGVQAGPAHEIQTRTVRVISTASSTTSFGYSSSEGSTFSLSGGLKCSAISSYENAAIMENTEDRRSTVVLLESPRAARDSDVSSLGSLHDDSDPLPPPGPSLILTDPRISMASRASVRHSTVSRNSRVTRLDEPVVLMRRSTATSVHSTSGGNHAGGNGGTTNVQRLSRSVYRDSHKSVARSVRSVRSVHSGNGSGSGSGSGSSGNSSRNGGSSDHRSTLEYLRDTSEYDAPFEQRNSESDWMDYQL